MQSNPSGNLLLFLDSTIPRIMALYSTKASPLGALLMELRLAHSGRSSANIITHLSAGSASVQFQRLDISDPKSVEEFGKWADSELKTVNVLVNNAGEALLWPLQSPHACFCAPLSYMLRRGVAMQSALS